ncbi:MAG: endonuclease III [Bacilli bacterium]|nr:endonuclease III [Bacilli bacterium]
MIDKNFFFSYLDELYSDAHCELNYTKDYELLIAIMLSAQTTDKAVNKATAILFSRYHSLEELANTDIKDIEKCLAFLGMYKNKAKNVIGIAQRIVNDFDGKVPSNGDDLLSLPGIGNKTKNCYLAEMYHEPLLAVDTHVQRISKRLGICKEKDDVVTMEKKLIKYIPSDRLIKTNHQIIWFGRYFCKAVKPNCEECKIKAFCKERH